MNNKKIDCEDLQKELRELRVEYKHLKSIYQNEIFELNQRINALRDSEAKYRFMFDKNPQPNWIYDCDTLSLLEVNDAAIIHYGYSREEFLSMNLKDICVFENNKNSPKDDVLTSWQSKTCEQIHYKKNGEQIFVEVVSYPVYLNNCNIVHAAVNDITCRKKTEKDLLESEINFHRSISESQVGIRIVTVTGETIYVNKAFLEMYELNSIEEFISMPTMSRYTNESYAQHVERLEKRKQGQEVMEYEVSFKCVNDDIRHLKISKKEVLWDGIKHFQAIIQDITEQRNAEEKLRTYSKVVEQSTNAICISDPEGTIEYVNNATLEATGFSKDELVGANTRIFGSGLKQNEEYTQLWMTIKSGNVWSGELCNKKKNGDLYWESVTISPVVNRSGDITHFFSVKVDVTEHKKMVHELTEAKRSAEGSEIFLRTFIENIPFEIWACDIYNVGVLENRKHISHFGSIIGEKLKYNFSNHENSQSWERNIKLVLSGEIVDMECEYEINQQRAVYQQIAFPILMKSNIIGIAGLNIDITARKFAEIALVNSEEQLRRFASHLQNVREEERSTLAREIHDDLGQILVALKIDLGLLRNSVIKDNSFICSDDVLSKFDDVSCLIDNTIKTTRRIMNGLRTEQLELLGLEIAIEGYLIDFENRNQLTCEFVSTISKNEINQEQTLFFFRILQEAMTNIVKYAKATLVKVELSHCENKLFMEIIDNGVGFDVKNCGRDDSYGLIGMKERVTLLKGKLFIKSKVGEGTSVRVEIPYLS
jgi:PAS domain S-box-containing protein